MIRKFFPWLCALSCVALLSGCVEKQAFLRPEPAVDIVTPEPLTPQQTQATLRSVAAMQDRLARVAAPLLLENHTSCKKFARPLMGFTARNQFSFSPKLAQAAHAALGLGDALEVAVIFPHSSAARSGLRTGDRLFAVDSNIMPQGAMAEEEAPRILVPLLSEKKKIDLTVVRQNRKLRIGITPSVACAFRIELGNADNVSSYSDGSRIMITRGMMHFVQSDTELAYVIAREMAHTALFHPYRLKTAPVAAKIIDALRPVFPNPDQLGIVTALQPFPKETDALADRLAVRMLKRADIDTSGVVAFWERLASQYPKNVATSHTAIHPHTAYRVAAMERALAAIAANERIR